MTPTALSRLLTPAARLIPLVWAWTGISTVHAGTGPGVGDYLACADQWSPPGSSLPKLIPGGRDGKLGIYFADKHNTYFYSLPKTKAPPGSDSYELSIQVVGWEDRIYVTYHPPAEGEELPSLDEQTRDTLGAKTKSEFALVDTEEVPEDRQTLDSYRAYDLARIRSTVRVSVVSAQATHSKSVSGQLVRQTPLYWGSTPRSKEIYAHAEDSLARCAQIKDSQLQRTVDETADALSAAFRLPKGKGSTNYKGTASGGL